MHDYTKLTAFIPSRDIDIVIFETRGRAPAFITNNATIVPPAGRVFLLGQGVKWDGFVTKTSALQDFYAKMEVSEPSRVVMAIDTDVTWANCQTDMLAKYLEISGSK